MLAPFTFQRNGPRDDVLPLVHRLVQLRLLVLISLVLLMAASHAYGITIEHWPQLGVLLACVAIWSVALLAKERLANTRHGAIREILIDFIWVLAVVALSGGSANPFIYYYLVLIAICASAFSARTAWLFCLLGILAYSGMLVLDLNAHFAHLADSYRAHLAGMWLNYVGSSLVTCYFVSRHASLIRHQQLELAQAREQNLKNEQLIGIGTVAASTVHALATPLSTLTVLAEEMAGNRDLSADSRQDLALMESQLARCKQTIQDLAGLAQGSSPQDTVPLAHLQNSLEEHYRLNSPTFVPHFDMAPLSGQCPVTGSRLLQHALINLINNAIESASAAVTISIRCQQQQAVILIANDTRLSTEALLTRWGKAGQSDKQTGLGIGSFLANSTIEKLGGSVRLEASAGSNGNTQVTVTVSLPLETGRPGQ